MMTNDDAVRALAEECGSRLAHMLTEDWSERDAAEAVEDALHAALARHWPAEPSGDPGQLPGVLGELRRRCAAGVQDAESVANQSDDAWMRGRNAGLRAAVRWIDALAAAPHEAGGDPDERLIAERDAAEDALQQTHIALGGDGEWAYRSGAEPPDSGDLRRDVPMLAAEIKARADRWPTPAEPAAPHEAEDDGSVTEAEAAAIAEAQAGEFLSDEEVRGPSVTTGAAVSIDCTPPKPPPTPAEAAAVLEGVLAGMGYEERCSLGARIEIETNIDPCSSANVVDAFAVQGGPTGLAAAVLRAIAAEAGR